MRKSETLREAFPEVAAQWHPTNNNGLTPDQVTPGSKVKAWWYLPYDDPDTGKHFDFEWEARINDRAIRKRGCPYLTNDVVWPGYNDLATRNPELAEQWHPAKNKGVTPDNVFANSTKWGWWIFPYDDSKTGKHIPGKLSLSCTDIRCRARGKRRHGQLHGRP